jgi:putative transposase
MVMLQAAVEAEAEEFVARYRDRRDARGRSKIVRNGYLPRREIVTGLGPIAVSMPRVRDRLGEVIRFRSSLVPAYVRRAKSIDALLPWLYLKGVASGDIHQALEALLGKEAKDLSANVIGRLKARSFLRSPRDGRRSMKPGPSGICPKRVGCMCGPMESTRGYAGKITGCVC